MFCDALLKVLLCSRTLLTEPFDLTKLNGYVLLVFSKEWTSDTAAWMIGNSMSSLRPCGFFFPTTIFKLIYNTC